MVRASAHAHRGTPVAPGRCMSRLTKLVVLGSIIAVGSTLLRKRAAVASRPAPTPAPPFDHLEPAVAAGIANVDPQPLTQIAGEGIDVEATEAAHRDVVEQRERLPRHGENIP
jgi:hypothetical protein